MVCYILFYFTLRYYYVLLLSLSSFLLLCIMCVGVSTIKSKSIVYLFPFTLVSDFINIRRAGVVLCCVVFV